MNYMYAFFNHNSVYFVALPFAFSTGITSPPAFDQDCKIYFLCKSATSLPVKFAIIMPPVFTIKDALNPGYSQNSKRLCFVVCVFIFCDYNMAIIVVTQYSSIQLYLCTCTIVYQLSVLCVIISNSLFRIEN